MCNLERKKTLSSTLTLQLWFGGANLLSGAFAPTLMARRSEGTRVACAPINVRLDKITCVTGPRSSLVRSRLLFPSLAPSRTPLTPQTHWSRPRRLTAELMSVPKVAGGSCSCDKFPTYKFSFEVHLCSPSSWRVKSNTDTEAADLIHNSLQ